MDRPPTEPAAEIRMAASATWQMYCALISEGFTPDQALTLVIVAIQAQSG